MPKEKKRKLHHDNDLLQAEDIHNQQSLGNQSAKTTQLKQDGTRNSKATTTSISDTAAGDLDTSKPTALFRPKSGGRQHTLSLALPGSIIANAKSHDQKTFLAGTIARALAVFCVDEVVVFDDGTVPDPGSRSHQSRGEQTAYNHSGDQHTKQGRHHADVREDENEYTAFSSPNHFLAHVLSYLETPPHLRKHLFPMHPNLRTAGTLPSLDMPHHLRMGEWSEYREGVTTTVSTARLNRGANPRRQAGTPSGSTGTYVDVGMSEPVFLGGVEIPPNVRVTIRIGQDSPADAGQDAEAVSPSTPREESGFYWGYTVRRCKSLSAVLSECPFEGGYDLSFGTSERGQPVSTLLHALPQGRQTDTGSLPPQPKSIPMFRHMLIVLGGVAGLEAAASNDPELVELGVAPSNVGQLFDFWVNLCPSQGSRTIRTEEAVWLSLMGLSEISQNFGI